MKQYIDLSSYQNQRWIIGVSGGIDSMVLLALAYQAKLDIVVVHINYGLRTNAYLETLLVSKVCKAYDYPLIIEYAPTLSGGNFQSLAREYRYDIFNKVKQTYQAQGVLIAHHQDDLLETYLMQKQAQRLSSYYGIKAEVSLNGLLVRRPLLSLSRNDIKLIANNEHILYLDDDSNLSKKYTRNKIRHEVVSKLNKDDRANLLLEIDSLNNKIEIELNSSLNRIELLALTDEACYQIICDYLISQKVYNLKKQKINDIVKLVANTNNWRYDLNDSYQLEHNYNELKVVEKHAGYSYQITSLEDFSTEYFKLSKSEGTYGFSVMESDFPLTIRTIKNSDRIKLAYGTKRLNRWFIDHKIPNYERALWPIVLNKDGKIIFVPKIGKDIVYNTYINNLFMLK